MNMEETELRRLIEFLKQRRLLMDATISNLEHLCSTALPAQKRAGRKSVDEQERRQISERMKARWATQKASVTQKSAAGAGSS